MKTDNIANRTKFLGTAFFEARMNGSQKIFASAADYPDGQIIPFHHHPRIQFLYASIGVMTVTTAQGIWVVPPFRAVWIPAHHEHQILASGNLAMRTLYIQPEIVANLPSQCCVVSVPPLLRELILYATTLSMDYPNNSPEERIMDVILDLIQTLDTAPLLLPTPQDSRLQKITHALTHDPADNRTLEDWGKLAGATSRTLARLFRNETGMSFRQWRQQARLLEALRQLARGDSVTTVALNLGYDSVSAFVAMFRKSLGNTPGQYFNQTP